MAQTILKNIRKEVFQPFRNELDKTDFNLKVEIENASIFKEKVIKYANSYARIGILNNNYKNQHSQEDFIACLGSDHELILNESIEAFQKIKEFVDANRGEWIFSALAYDLKNDVEDLTSTNPKGDEFPLSVLFVPEVIIYIDDHKVCIKTNENAKDIWSEIQSIEIQESSDLAENDTDFQNIPSREGYLTDVGALIGEIEDGNIYEINYCRNSMADLEIDPFATCLALNQNSPAPFSSLFKYEDQYLICASPERFLLKNGQSLVSQPIKGTRRRSQDALEDDALKDELYLDTKERAENVMIVDLVRNDLSHTAERGSVKVRELFGIYTFPHVHQMISTIESTLKKEIHFIDALKYCFPMGSMTGAPKLRAMKLIEQYEHFQRGLFSGSLGLISPNQNFDFNVVIRSIFYDDRNRKVSIKTGSAITALCDPEKEWEECELKANALLKSIRRKR